MISRGIHPVVLLAGYVVAALLPVALAAWQDLPPRPFLDDFSSAIAMMAFSVMLVEFVLSGRFRGVSGRIGIDTTMRFHQVMARTLTVLVLVHPFLYTLPMSASRPWDTTGALTLDLAGASMVTGGLAWLLLPALVLMAVFRRDMPYRYETWRLVHGLGAAAIALLTLHHAVEAGRYSGGQVLAVFWMVMVAVAFLTLFYVYVISALLKRNRPYRVVSVEPVAERTWELVVAPENGEAMEFEAGQFVWLTVGRSPFAITEHPFSISSSPADRPRIGFAIKEAGDFTNGIGTITAGTVAYLDGPHGHVVLPEQPGRGIVFIAGGVGLAPIMSMLRQLRANRDPRPVKLVYGNRIAGQIMYEEELDAMTDAMGLELVHVLSEPPPDWRGETGTIDEALLRRVLPADGSEWHYVICGPAPMIDGVGAILARAGIPASRVLAEKFSYD